MTTWRRRAEKALILFIVVVPIVATIWAMVLLWNRLVTGTDVALLVTMYAITACGIGIGFHRLATHRSFEAVAPVRFIAWVAGSMALQGPLIMWVATHVKHHAEADKEGDPHSPLHGFIHAHLGWLFVDRDPQTRLYAAHLYKDPVAVFVSRTFPVWAVLSFAIPFAIGGWTGLLWGGLVRVFLMHHVTWSVNSVCHRFGRRTFDTKDESRNQWLVGVLGLGEGWHNNHHAFPRSAHHGLRWWQIDINAYIIRLLQLFHLARNVVMPKREDMQARRVKKAKRATAR